MKCQILFSGKNKKNIINLSSAENAQRVVKVKRIFFQNHWAIFRGVPSVKEGIEILFKWSCIVGQDGSLPLNVENIEKFSSPEPRKFEA